VDNIEKIIQCLLMSLATSSPGCHDKRRKYTGKNETLQQFDYLREASKKRKVSKLLDPATKNRGTLGFGPSFV